MRGRPGKVIALLLVLATLALGGCDSKGGGPQHSPSSTSREPFPTGTPAVNVDCPKFKDIAQRVTTAQTTLYTPGADRAAALQTLTTDLTALKDAAPVDVDGAIDDMIAAFRSAADLVSLASPSAAEAERLRKLGPRLSADSQKITQYITSSCK